MRTTAKYIFLLVKGTLSKCDYFVLTCAEQCLLSSEKKVGMEALLVTTFRGSVGTS